MGPAGGVRYGVASMRRGIARMLTTNELFVGNAASNSGFHHPFSERRKGYEHAVVWMRVPAECLRQEFSESAARASPRDDGPPVAEIAHARHRIGGQRQTHDAGPACTLHRRSASRSERERPG